MWSPALLPELPELFLFAGERNFRFEVSLLYEADPVSLSRRRTTLLIPAWFLTA
jgi:hypothetical protein